LGLQALGEHLLDPQILGTSIIPLDGIRFLRAYGLSDHPNILGGSIAFSLIILFAVILYGKNRLPLFASIIFLISFPALMMTFSRSAWLSFVLATSFTVACEAVARRWDSVKRASLLGMLSLFVILPIMLQQIDVFEKRVNAGDISSDGPMFERAYLLERGNTLFVEHSALGIGLSATPLALERRFDNFPLPYQPPHYVPLLVALETGLLGGIFYLILFFLPLILFIANWRTCIHKPFIMASLALIFAISIVSLFDYYTWYVTGRVWQWLAWGIFSLALTKAK
jgi:O-antigen ligase